MSQDASPPPSFSPLRRLGIGLNVVLGTVALLALVLMANYLAARHFHRFYLASQARYPLSPATTNLLASLTNEVRVSVLFAREDPLFGPISGLLKEYAYRCPKLIVENVDYKRDPARAELVVSRYQLPANDVDLIVFGSGVRTRVVRAGELSEYDWPRLLAGEKEVRRVAFKGEALFTAAIAGLAEARSPVAYFLQGHGEHDPAGNEALLGYSTFARLLQHKNLTLKALTLQGASDLPDDCALLVVAGPQSAFARSELERIAKYLAQGGRLLALLSLFRAHGQPTGMESLLAAWGVAVGNNYTLDDDNSPHGNDLVCTNFTAHPIVKPLWRDAVFLVLPRSVDPVQAGAASADAPKVMPLVLTGDKGYTASETTATGSPKTNPLRDRRGAIPVILAVEKGSLPGVSADRGSTRMVVAGESVFLGNEAIESRANVQFASLAINWLLDRPQQLAGIAPRPIHEYRIALTRTERLTVRWLLLAGLPGVVLLVGVLVWVRRRA